MEDRVFLDAAGPVCAYLIQGSAANLAKQAFPPHALIYQLSYDRPAPLGVATMTLFSNTASWAEGRNLLLSAAIENAGARIDYYVFCDDDVVFARGGFSEFERLLGETRPLVGLPLMPKAEQSPTLDSALRVQRALAIDEQIVAIHRSALGQPGLAPLIAEHDGVSWYVASLIFEYICLTRHGPLTHQYNEIVVENDGHVWETGETLYHRGDFGQMLDVVAKTLAGMTGGYDSTVIEQFDPDRENSHPARVRERARLDHLPVK